MRSVLAASLAALTLAACAAPATVSTKADTGSKAAASSAPTTAAKVGQAITLKGNSGEQVSVTPVKIVNPATAGQFEEPQAGEQYVAVQFRLKNVGKVAYSDSPQNGAKVSDSQDQQFAATIVQKIKAGPVLPADLKIPPGGSALGYLVFNVPKGAKIAGVEFALNSGFGGTAQWKA